MRVNHLVFIENKTPEKILPVHGPAVDLSEIERVVLGIDH